MDKTGFIYIWRDRIRKMYYVGSHDGAPDDGYISSSHWLTAEVRYRPQDFKRRIVKFVSLDKLKVEEYKLISCIKEQEFGTKYYNLKHGRPKGSDPWNKGKTNIYSCETLEKMSKARLGKPTTKGRANPLSADNARKGAAKLASVAKGRKRVYRDDGSWTWQYPEK